MAHIDGWQKQLIFSFFFLIFLILIYLAVIYLDVNCNMQDPQSSLQHVGSSSLTRG